MDLPYGTQPGSPEVLIIGSRTGPSHLFRRGGGQQPKSKNLPYVSPRSSILVHSNVTIGINKINIRNIANVLRLGAMQCVITRWIELMAIHQPLFLPMEGDELGPDRCVPVQRVLHHVELYTLLPLLLRPVLTRIKGWHVDARRRRKSSSFDRLKDDRCRLAVHRRPKAPSGKAAHGDDCCPLENGDPQEESGGDECVHFAQ